ncbi:Crp/Fnr family transcriptional regulator [Tsuneonella mangrovi]|uniref:Crp/Fnr family transcriptional regulator n=1 Tax=Tsuneonella mangrovi TaxID=1982042 RepID=UPI000BA2BA1C|nr:Crp/Fnr family transcriptional regulator [Tsuneonella mangrovi]
MQRTYHFSEIGPTRAEGDIFALLVSVGRRHSFAAGSQVLHRGDQPTGFWLIESGHLMACRFGRDGERILYGVLGKGDLVGELACLTHLPQQVNAIAEDAVELVWIDLPQIDRLLANEPRFARWMLASMAHKMRTALDRIESDYSLSAQVRIARVLADLATSDGPDLEITQQEMADFVGVSRVTVGKILSDFAAKRLVDLGYGKISVTDPNGITAYCG